MNLSACAAPIYIGRDKDVAPVRSAAFGAYPEYDRPRCEALTKAKAEQLYPVILPTGRCNPNNHHAPHDDHQPHYSRL